MATGDRIDPGPGWRLLEVGEMRDAMDEFFRRGKWTKTSVPGTHIIYGSYPTRRRIDAEPRTIKGVATRATVICGTPDGARAINTISRESGLTEYDCERIRRAWDNMQVSTAKYVMLEIQREGEP